MSILQFIYSIWVILLFIINILAAFPFVLLSLLLPEKYRHEIVHTILRFISHTWMIPCGMIPKVRNEHFLKQHTCSVIICNHSSYIDAAISYIAIPQLFKSLGKFEIGKTPIFGTIYKCVVILIDRSSAMARAKSFITMKQYLQHGNSILIFPEGTFKDEVSPNLLPFHDGAFKLAIDAQIPIQPLLYLNANKRMHPASVFKFTPGFVTTVYLPPISTKGINKTDDHLLKNYCYNFMSYIYKNKHTIDVKDIANLAQQWLNNNKLSA